MSAVVEAARGRWSGILQALGVNASFLRNVHGPCPICGGKDRFRFDDQSFGKWICGQCGSGDGFSLLMELNGWSFKDAATRVEAIVGSVEKVAQKAERTEAQKVKDIRDLLLGSFPIKGTPAEAYLERRCGQLGPVQDLRYHPACRYSKELGTFPALLAVLRYPDGRGASVHRTYLTLDGRKADLDPVRKIMPGLPLNTSCVRLAPIAERIGLAEGIETALCASKRFAMPVWSAISAGGMIAWEPPVEIREVVIFADNDENFTGQQAAYTLAKRLALKGIKAEVCIPETVGTDWADVVMQKVS